MKNVYRSILFVVIILIILADFGLFLFRQPLFALLRQQLTATNVGVVKIGTSSADTLDLEILKLPHFSGAKNVTTAFDFEQICVRPNSASVTVSAPINPELLPDDLNATSTELIVPESIDCRQGNVLPFSAKNSKTK